jgi:hypothetical protein
LTLSNNIFAGQTGSSFFGICNIDGGGTIFEYCTPALSISSGSSISNFVFKYNTVGAYINGATGVSVKNCTFLSNTTGIGARPFGMLVDSCNFTSDTNSIYIDQYSSDCDVVNCSFTTPVTYAINKELGARTVYVSDCTIDAPSDSKAINNISGAFLNIPNFILKNSFNSLWPDGFYYPYFVFCKDNETHSIAPSFRLQFASTVSTNYVQEIELSKTFVPSGDGKTISIWVKANSAWAGTIVPRWRLNGKLIKEETSITSIGTSWVNLTYTVADNLITTDGELVLTLLPNANNIACFFDDVEWS